MERGTRADLGIVIADAVVATIHRARIRLEKAEKEYEDAQASLQIARDELEDAYQNLVSAVDTQRELFATWTE